MAGPYRTATSVVFESHLEAGDRLEVDRAGPDQLRLLTNTAIDDISIHSLQDAQGRTLPASFDSTNHLLTVEDLDRAPPERNAALWIEFQEAGKFRLVSEPLPASGADAELTTEQGIRLAFDERNWELLRTGPAQPTATLAELDLALRAARLAKHAGFDRLICLPMVRDMELLEHQIRTAKTVLQRFRGRALLCDEVGLGKTIEAGLVLSELVMRGLARSVLVLTPPSLIEQWQGEMRRKFSLDIVNQDDPAFRQKGADAWTRFDRVIVSLHTAKREPHRSAILARHWVSSAPKPAATAAARLAQMRQLARRFAAKERFQGAELECRLLTQPIDRYQSEAQQIADGAIFVYVISTNPERGVVLETDGKRWRYGTLRLTSTKSSVTLDGREVTAYEYLDDRTHSKSYGNARYYLDMDK